MLDAAFVRTQCPVCVGGHASVAFDRLTWSKQFADGGNERRDLAAIMAGDASLAFETMLRCDGCGTLFTDRVPDSASLGRFYQTYYGDAHYTNKLRLKLRRARRRIFLLKWLTRGRRFLDVGCSIGCAVEAARQNGFDATGTDVSPYALDLARRQFPRNRFLEGSINASEPTATFDLVWCTEVIEHVPRPADFLRTLAATVAPRGVLFLTTPDAGHPSVRGNLIAWDQVKPPEHLTLFTRAALTEALAPFFRSLWFVPQRKPGLNLVARRG